jgi:alpha-tubulin suppressor-like RCC1 family protein
LSTVARIVPFSRRSTFRLLAGAVFCALILVCTSSLAGAASSKASSATISAHLTKKSFTKAQAKKVKLIYKFSATSKSFSYLLSYKKGSKWQTVKSVKRTGSFSGSKSMTVKQVFSGKSVKVGSYRLKLSADGGNKLLSFKVVNAGTPTLRTGSKPTNTALPTVSGTTTQGQALSASKGSWANSPTSYSYQWRRCDLAGNACSDISGATSASYVLQGGDVSNTVRGVVKASNSYGSASATSSRTAVVAGLPPAVVTVLPPANTALPTISGTTTQGQTLTAANGSWSNSPTSYSYQWRRCTSSSNCVDISSAASGSYTLVAADIYFTIRVVVTAKNSAGSLSATSGQTAVIDGLPPVNLVLPTISGTPAQGQTLTSSTGSWSNSPYDYYYAWYRCDSSGANCVYISGAYRSSYSLTSSDVGKTIRVVVEADNDYSWATATSSQTGVVGVPPANTSLPTVSGPTSQGQTLTTANGSWSNSPTSFSYRWRRCDTYGASCADITGATSNSYVLVSGDVGKTVRVVVTATSSYGSTSATSGRTGLVSATPTNTLPPANSSLPTISGTAIQGRTLAASDGSWNNSPTSYTYQWSRCNSSGASCVDITSATSNSYVLVSGDVGKTVRVVVTATNSYGSASATSTQTTVVTAPLPTSVSAGSAHTCALLSSGTVKCWGDNNSGQLGDGSATHYSSTPVSVSGISTASQVSAGSYHSCALLDDGTVKCWGVNDYGQLGDGSTTDSSTPVSVSGIANATKISVGSYYSCALLSGGAVKCWGYNYDGELGNGSTIDYSSTPVSVSGISTASQVSAGRYHSCALLSGGAVKCWGYNYDGELGNGSTIDYSSTPVSVSGISTATQISGGGYHSCALLSGGAVKCWGNNGYGELGNGSTIDSSSTPVPVSAISTATQISGGGHHSCALLSDSTVECWGYNGYGQLGNDSTNNRSTPVQVKGVGGTGTLSNVTQISGGGYHSCALLVGSTVECWGDNEYGQLGDGSTSDRWTPVSVTGLP